MADFITVKASDTGGRVALFERHSAHPTGEAFVSGESEVQVARTPLVDNKLKDGVLVEVSTNTPEETPVRKVKGK